MTWDYLLHLNVDNVRDSCSRAYPTFVPELPKSSFSNSIGVAKVLSWIIWILQKINN